MTRNDDVFPVEHGDIPASYVSLPNLPISSKNGQFWLLQKSSQFLESTAIILWGKSATWLTTQAVFSNLCLQSITKDPGNLPPGKLTWQWKMDPE